MKDGGRTYHIISFHIIFVELVQVFFGRKWTMMWMWMLNVDVE